MATWGQAISIRGVKGDQGIQGADGVRGSLLTELPTGTPSDSNAGTNPGDFAFVNDSQLFYVRGTNGWPANGILLRGAMGLSGVDGFFGTGPSAPTDDIGAGQNGIYVAASGEIYTRTKDGGWTDTTQNLTGPKGADGLRGSQTYFGVGDPPSDLSSFTPPAAPRDTYYNIDPNDPNCPKISFLS